MSEKKLKVAIQLFGHLRTYERCAAPLMRHLARFYDTDVFMHTWSTLDHNTKTWHSDFLRNAQESAHDRAEEINRLYGLKAFAIDNQGEKDVGSVIIEGRSISIYGISCMLKSLEEVTRLREDYARQHNIEYDFVLYIRPDILLMSDFRIESFVKGLTDEEIKATCFAAGNCTVARFNDFRMIAASDILFFGKPDIFPKIFSILKGKIENLKDGEIFPYRREYWLMARSMTEAGYPPTFLDFRFGEDFDILRDVSLRRFKKQLISFRVNRKGISLSLFSFLPFGIRIRIGK